MRQFPHDFVWGVATSSYQIEGATDADGRGESIWDRFAATPGKIADGTNGNVACDHYHRWREDVELMRWMGLKAYRFSVAWPRVFPMGRGKVNTAGLDFYSRLVDGLLEVGIEPVVTLYHWDLPQALQDKGGWASRDTVSAFVEYADVMSQKLGDRVSRWITHNEPWCISILGYANGEHAPGIKDWGQALATAHHVLLSHGQAVPVIRANVPRAEVGVTLNLVPAEPASPSKEDQDACRAFDGGFNRWYLDPLYGKGYPRDVIDDHVAEGRLKSDTLPFVRQGDMADIAAPIDFLGVNYYNRGVIRSDRIPEAQNAPRTVHVSPEKTEMDWEVSPHGLTQLLVRLHQDYKPGRLYVTENGAAYGTTPDADGRVRDTKRVHYLRTHLEASLEAIKQGVPLKGYFAWSLLDNFEWAYGYQKRFGMVYVDYATQKRIPKDSAHLYRAVVAQNGLDVELAA
ncbi:beta-glucosidase [Myxococcus llanfairpwllgwyngyllgogerychwyrndrobwllllantysiliogogogochensis]|uniref:Beta-glucosidase n=1 Tax=Myxococcus llanfairpwllgwyngyllgogerychwyrndrobwllllantysiliogogogochensis TaxID=2590453 RepID=A0A540WXZ6_9BACT|nr:GH1 family beta-glucosidase [Myxococcus llanfairpwllgwyngyllgogerychwyrndrobwllllantysiliogogogochensis]TQF13873.1 beta-glucosidase [Myxococcus llanfairpwllgwyngyllgogerychwyrndrobwllllantysiliogogogochensis]